MTRLFALAALCALASVATGCASRPSAGSVASGPMPEVAARLNGQGAASGPDQLRLLPTSDFKRPFVPLTTPPDVLLLYGWANESRDGLSFRGDFWISTAKDPSRPLRWGLSTVEARESIPLSQASDLRIDREGRLLIQRPVNQANAPVYTLDPATQERIQSVPGSPTRPWTNSDRTATVIEQKLPRTSTPIADPATTQGAAAPEATTPPGPAR